MNKKRFIFALLALIGMCLNMLMFPAAGLSGFVGGARWNDVPRTPIIVSTQGSLNSIHRAYVAIILNPAQTLATLGFMVHADVEPCAPVGAVLLLGNREIGRWQQGDGAVYDQADYSLRGAAWFPTATSASYYHIVLELGSRHSAAFDALAQLHVRLICPQGSPSLPVSFPIVTEQPAQPPMPEPPAAPQTTTTTRAPTTTTTAPPLTFPQQPTTTTTRFVPPTLPPVVTTAPVPQPTQPDQFFTVTAWHTVIIENTTVPTTPCQQPDMQLTFAQQQSVLCPPSIDLPPGEIIICPEIALAPEQSSELLPIILAPAVPVTQNNTWLFAAGGGLLLLAVVLVIYWAKTHKTAPKED